MTKILLSAMLAFGAGSALANELDGGHRSSQRELQDTIIVRVNTRDNSVSYVRSGKKLTSKEQAKALAKAAKFSKVPASKIRSELDQDGGSSSWYVYGGAYGGRGYGYGGAYGGYGYGGAGYGYGGGGYAAGGYAYGGAGGYAYGGANLSWYGQPCQPYYGYQAGGYNYYYYNQWNWNNGYYGW